MKSLIAVEDILRDISCRLLGKTPRGARVCTDVILRVMNIVPA
jgi:hypothetical protein